MIKYPNGQPYKKNEISKRKKSDSEISISKSSNGTLTKLKSSN